MAWTEDSFKQLIVSSFKSGVSDIHLRQDEKPSVRIKGDLCQVKKDVLSYEDMINTAKWLIDKPKIVDEIETLKEYDGSYAVVGVCRVRYNYLKYQGKIGLILRLISDAVPSLDDFNYSNVLKKIAEAQSGLVLVTGATGSGKSTTLAAMIDHINKNIPSHILTLEDPVEFIHRPKKSRVTQREIGKDTEDFSLALRSALRQDPDIILIGEMRDQETVSIALKAAETGHLVFGTVHTTDALSTIGRLVSMFPPEEQHIARSRIADNLYATISQRLLKTKDGKGRVAAQEIMLNNPGIRECILNPVIIKEIYIYIQKGKTSSGAQSFDQHITELYKQGLISFEEAKANASNPEDFERNLNFGESA